MHVDLMRTKERTFPELPDKEQITSLRIWHCKYKTLTPLGELRALEKLVIGSFPDSSFDILSTLSNLRSLQVLHLPAVTDLVALAKLQNLESLSLATLPSWDASGRRTLVHSLTPLTSLPHLKHLELFGVCPTDQSLSALIHCPALQTTKFSGYPKAQVAQLQLAKIFE